jgi:hypothetical protein
VVSVTYPYGLIFGFLDRSRYFYEAEWTPFQTHYFLFLVVPGIDPEPLDL